MEKIIFKFSSLELTQATALTVAVHRNVASLLIDLLQIIKNIKAQFPVSNHIWKIWS